MILDVTVIKNINYYFSIEVITGGVSFKDNFKIVQ